MIQFKSESGGVLVLTLLLIMILSILGLAMLPLSVMEYKISHNFSDFEKAYYIAEAGLEEAIAELNHYWGYSGKKDQTIHSGVYDIHIEGEGQQRTITASGKIGTIYRTIKAEVEKSVSSFDLSEMKEFAIFSQGDLEIGELGDINGGIIGTHGDLDFKFAKKNIKSSLLIKGEVLSKGKVLSKDELANKNFPSITNRELVDLSSFNMDAYIDWLNEKFEYTVKEENNTSPGKKKLVLVDTSYPTEKTSILIIQNYEEVTLNGTFNGLIIVNNADRVKIGNRSIVNGMIIFARNDLERTELQITGSIFEINGSLIFTNSRYRKGNWKLKINHDTDILDCLDEYLQGGFKIPNEGNQSIDVLDWKEID